MKIYNWFLVLVLSLILSIILGSCKEESNELPKDINELKKMLIGKQTDLRSLQKEVATIEAKIDSIQPSKPKSRSKVVVETVEKEDFKRYVTIFATVEPSEVVSASSETGGRIKKIFVKEGQSVRRGAQIASIDMEQLDKQIAEINISLDLAKDVFVRQKRLWDQQIGSEIQFLQAENNVKKLEKTLETIRFQQSKSIVTAPISGIVDMEILKEGELTAPGSPIVQIMNDRKVKVVAEIPEKYLNSTKKGDLLDIDFPAIDEKRKGKISMIGRTINPANRTFKIEIALNNAKGNLKPNLTGEVLLNDYNESGVVVVRSDLVQQEVGGKFYIMVAEKSADLGMVAKRVYVETGNSYDGTIIIIEVLKGGEQIIAEGGLGLVNKELIEL